jgi:GNAT superfamily N-acetyltransferase
VSLSRGMEVVPHTDVREFARLAHPLFAADPVRHTIALTVIQGIRHAATVPVTMLTLHEDDAVVGALLRTVERPALVSGVPIRCAGIVVDTLASLDPEVEGAQGPAENTEAVAQAWQARTGASLELGMRMRLFALEELRAPVDVLGSARVVGAGDLAAVEVLSEWRNAFDVEMDRTWSHPHMPRDDVATALASGAGELIWEVDGEPVAQASARAVTAGMSRIGPVYTPPERRGRGYAAAVTSAASRWALDRGARHVLIYTDLANPTTNRLYPRLGYRPRYDALELRFVRRRPDR